MPNCLKVASDEKMMKNSTQTFQTFSELISLTVIFLLALCNLRFPEL